jgi:hypothetical protein
VPSNDAITGITIGQGHFVAATDSGSDVWVFSFDGKSTSAGGLGGRLTVTGKSTGIVARFRDQWLFAADSQSFWMGSDSAPWAEQTFPGTVTAFVPRQFLEYGDNMYVGGTDGTNARILRWDGTSLTLAHSMTGATSGAFLAMEVFDSKLCYLWSSTA